MAKAKNDLLNADNNLKSDEMQFKEIAVEVVSYVNMRSQTSNIVKDFANDTKKILKGNLVAEYLFGSYARNEQTEISDIDILIIVRQLNSSIRREISSLSSDYSLERNSVISPIIKDINVWEKNRFYNTLFYMEIERDGIKLL